MERSKLLVFDLDGTLYKFKESQDGSMLSSKFYSDVKKNILKFISQRLELSKENAELEYERVKKAYNEHASIGFEKEHGIDRLEYFEKCWNLDPKDYITASAELGRVFESLDGRKAAVLTGAPRVWAEKALKHLQVYKFVKGAVFTGEPDVRKPSLEAFRQVLDFFKTRPEQACSIGDQEGTDIEPAKRLGMKTVIVGKESQHADFRIEDIGGLEVLLSEGKV